MTVAIGGIIFVVDGCKNGTSEPTIVTFHVRPRLRLIC